MRLGHGRDGLPLRPSCPGSVLWSRFVRRLPRWRGRFMRRRSSGQETVRVQSVSSRRHNGSPSMRGGAQLAPFSFVEELALPFHTTAPRWGRKRASPGVGQRIRRQRAEPLPNGVVWTRKGAHREAHANVAAIAALAVVRAQIWIVTGVLVWLSWSLRREARLGPPNELRTAVRVVCRAARRVPADGGAPPRLGILACIGSVVDDFADVASVVALGGKRDRPWLSERTTRAGSARVQHREQRAKSRHWQRNSHACSGVHLASVSRSSWWWVPELDNSSAL